MKLCMVGTGYVGLVSGACFAETGNQVVCADIDEKKIERLRAGEVPIFEPGLEEVIERNVAGGRLSFSSDVAAAIAASEVVFVAVGTPSRSDGGADLSAVDKVAETVAESVEREMVLVLKSTVPVGTNTRVRRIVAGAPHPVHVVSNPEFLKEGDAVNDFLRPDRIVLGCDEDGPARDVMGRLYHPVCLDRDRIVWMDPVSAELTKYVANTMLAMRISFMNEIAALCEKVGADVHSVRHGVGSDQRIGSKFLYAGPGYGGSCLTGDESLLVHRDGRTRLTTFEALFREERPDVDDDRPEPLAIEPEGLLALAWDRAEGRARFAPVSALTRRPYEGDLLEVRTKMGRRVRCTPDHPFVVVDPATGRTDDRLAADLTTDDWLPVTRGPVPPPAAAVPEHLDVLDALPSTGVAPADVIVRLDATDRAHLDALGLDRLAGALAPLGHPRGRERARDILRSGALRLPEARHLDLPLAEATLGTAKNGTYIPRRIPLDAAFFRVVGLYLAEGHCTVDGARHRLCWSFHPSEEPALVDEVACYLTGLGIKRDVRATRTTMQVSVSSRLLARLFLGTLGLGEDCYSHRIPDLLWDRPADDKRALLAGVWHGDGSWSYIDSGPSVVLEHGTVSRPLSDGMLRLLGELDVVGRLKVGRTAKSTTDTYWLVVSGADQVERLLDFVPPYDAIRIRDSLDRQAKRIAPTGYRRLAEAGTTAVRVVSARPEPFRGFVYSLEIPGPQTVVTTAGLVVHNCFPKDVRALVNTGREAGVELELAATTDRVNDRQKGVIARKLKQHFDGDLRGKRVAIWGIAFKPRTDDIRESATLTLIDTLLSEGAQVVAHDPEAMDEARPRYGDRVTFVDDAYDAAMGADALVLMTEWRQYQNPNFDQLAAAMRRKLIIDGRNIWSGYGLRKQGFTYEGIGAQGS